MDPELHRLYKQFIIAIWSGLKHVPELTEQDGRYIMKVELRSQADRDAVAACKAEILKHSRYAGLSEDEKENAFSRDWAELSETSTVS